MGVLKRGILGGFSNKVANVVGSSWKGIAVIKSLPLSVANPRTALQQTQRGKFSAIVHLAGQALAGVVKPLWDRFAHQMSGYNAFIRANIGVMSDTGILTPAQFVISSGTLKTVPITSATLGGSRDEVLVEWNSSIDGGNGSATDEVYMLVVDVTNNNVLYAGTEEPRSTGGAEFAITPAPVGASLWIYLAARAADGRIVSNTTATIVA